MPRISIALLLCLLPVLATAQQQVFRYVDKNGHVVYTDTAPPTDAKSVQQKKLGGNFIETSEPSYALQVAQQRNPVTLYSGDCGPTCEQARNLLNRRGVPFRDIDPAQPGELEKMRQVTGDSQVPVLVVGLTSRLKGFEEQSWQVALDQAGYPKTPPTRVVMVKREADKAAVDKAAADKAAADKAAAAKAAVDKAAADKAAGKPAGSSDIRSSLN